MCAALDLRAVRRFGKTLQLPSPGQYVLVGTNQKGS
jgi:hypothetical protein